MTRPLSGGDFAAVLLNNAPGNATVTCDAACFERMTGRVPAALRAGRFRATFRGGDRVAAASFTSTDLWTGEVRDLRPPFQLSASVGGNGGTRAFRLKPR